MSSVAEGKERRIHPRYGFNFVMGFKHPESAVNSAVTSEPLEMAGTDLSVSGVGGVACPENWGGAMLKPGQKMMVKLMFEGESEAFNAAAKVMWSRQREGKPGLQQIGLKFVYVSTEALASLLGRVSRLTAPKA